MTFSSTVSVQDSFENKREDVEIPVDARRNSISIGTQFPTSSTATKRVTFGQTAVSTANTSRSGYKANREAAPLNEDVSRPPLDAPQHLPTRSYSPFTNTPYQPWLYNVDYDSMLLPRPEFFKF